MMIRNAILLRSFELESLQEGSKTALRCCCDHDVWAVVADPLLYPSVGLGFRFGRQPEIFSVASPTSGLMFSNDILPVKVRYFFATGPTDWRGLYKQNVP